MYGDADTNLLQLYGAISKSLEESRTVLYELVKISQPINRLPPEILCKILSLVPDDISFRWNLHAVPKLRPTFMQDVRQYHPLLLTCRYWNKLVTNTSAFWSTIDDFHVVSSQIERSLFERYVARCTDGPLCIFVRRGPTRQMRQMCCDPGFTSRVKQIVYSCTEPVATCGACNSFLSSSYPNLDTCVVRHPQHRNGIPSPIKYRILPDSTRLRRLWIDHTIPTTAFPALEELRIRNLDLNPTSEAPLCIFISHSPLLQVIELHARLRGYSPMVQSDWQGRVIPLSALRDLTFAFEHMESDTTSPPTPGPFFRIFTTYFAIPPNCTINCGRIRWEHLNSFAPLLNAAGTGAVHSARLTLDGDEVNFSAATADGVQLGFSTLTPDHDWYKFEDCPDDYKEEFLDLTVVDVYWSRFHLRTFISSPALSQIRRLHVGKFVGWTLARPASILFSLPLLEHLVIADPEPRPPHLPILEKALEALVSMNQVLALTEDGELVQIEDGELVCPKLKRLIVTCQGTEGDVSTPPPWVPQLNVFQKTEEVAAARASLGCPIERIFFFFMAEDPAMIQVPEGQVTYSLRLHEYDATGSLARTLHGKAAREVAEQLEGWYGD
ncbi:hypothetical protein C8Q70DRAFT_209664 [Cubamyces menziesii]|nr:hypothetical protein C8Q70DRAFT_209664 [Cubamyces menziesii]